MSNFNRSDIKKFFQNIVPDEDREDVRSLKRQEIREFFQNCIDSDIYEKRNEVITEKNTNARDKARKLLKLIKEEISKK